MGLYLLAREPGVLTAPRLPQHMVLPTFLISILFYLALFGILARILTLLCVVSQCISSPVSDRSVYRLCIPCPFLIYSKSWVSRHFSVNGEILNMPGSEGCMVCHNYSPRMT